MKTLYKKLFFPLALATFAHTGMHASKNEIQYVDKKRLALGIAKATAACAAAPLWTIGSTLGTATVLDYDDFKPIHIGMLATLIGSTGYSIASTWYQGGKDLKKAFKKSSMPKTYIPIVAASTMVGLALGFASFFTLSNA